MPKKTPTTALKAKASNIAPSEMPATGIADRHVPCGQ
jgi:hypothetical protein